MSLVYDKSRGILQCPPMSSGEYSILRTYVVEIIQTDQRLVIVDVPQLEDKILHSDLDVYLCFHPQIDIILKELFPSLVINKNDKCLSIKVKEWQVDFITLVNPKIESLFYCTCFGLLFNFLNIFSPIKLRSTDLCYKVNREDDFTISDNPTDVCAFFGINLDMLKQATTRDKLFDLIKRSSLYNPELIVGLDPTSKDMRRQIMIDFITFCSQNPLKIPYQPKTLQDVLTFFGKEAEYEAFLHTIEEKHRQQQISESNQKKTKHTKDCLMLELTKRNIMGKEAGEKLKYFKEWIVQTYKISYDEWVLQDNLNIPEIFKEFYL